MELKILVEDLKRIVEISKYNHNYYKLPLNINGCNVLYGKSDDDVTTLWALGKLVDEEFQHNCWLGESCVLDCPEYIDLKEANQEMIWT